MGLLSVACTPKADDGDRTVLRVANWGGAKEGNAMDLKIDAIYREFERRNPGIVVREESTPGDYVAKMSLAFIADAQPDVLALDASSAALFIEGGLVENLTPQIGADRDFRLDDYYPNAVNVARREKALYAIPIDFTPLVLYYNKRLFDRAGVAYPTGDWNFADFRAAAKRLTIPHADDTKSQYGYAFSNWPAGWVVWLWNNGADHVAPDGRSVSGYLDSPAAAEAVGYLRDLVKVDRSAPSQSQLAAMGEDLFAGGRAAMTVSGHWSMVGYGNAPKGRDGKPKIALDDLGVAPLPHQVPESQSVIYEAGYAIAKRSRNKEAAWRFIRYMTSREVQEQYQSGNIAICARRDVAEARAKASAIERQFLAIVPTGRPPYGSRIEEYAAVEEGMQKAMDGVLSSGRDPQEALTRAARAIDREFAKR